MLMAWNGTQTILSARSNSQGSAQLSNLSRITLVDVPVGLQCRQPGLPPKTPLLSASILVTSHSLLLHSWSTHALDLLLDIIHALAFQHARKGEEPTQDDRGGDELVHRSPGDGGRGLVTEVDPVEDREPETPYEGCEAAGCGIGEVSETYIHRIELRFRGLTRLLPRCTVDCQVQVKHLYKQPSSCSLSIGDSRPRLTQS